VKNSAPLVVALCLSGVAATACVTGCSAKIITPGASASPRPSSDSAPPSTGPGSGGPGSGSGGTPGVSVGNTRVTVGGSLGSFPIPAGSQVVENVTSGRTIELVLGSVTPSRVSSFYASALPRAGFAVASNTLATGSSITGVSIEFTGHGYKGTIGALSNLGITGLGGFGKDIVGITLAPQ
jgi:hypothetical protein